MPYDGVYKLNTFIQKNSVPDYPLAVYIAKEQGNLHFHEHDFMELAIVSRGIGWHILEEERRQIQAGDVLLIPPGVRHAYEYGKKNRLSLVNIMYDGNRLPIPVIDATDIPLFHLFFPVHLKQEASSFVAPILHLGEQKLLRRVISQVVDLKEELAQKRAGNMFGSIVIFLNLILTLLRSGNPLAKMERTKGFPLGDVLKYINEHLTQKIPMTVLVRKSFLSQRRFQFKFKQTTGYTVTDYINHRRIELAMILLKDRTGDVLQVGTMCGYNSANYFIRKFKEILGCTPREYLRALKQ